MQRAAGAGAWIARWLYTSVIELIYAYVYIYNYMYVYMYIYICVCVCHYMYVYVCVCISIYVCVCLYLYLYLYPCVCLWGRYSAKKTYRGFGYWPSKAHKVGRGTPLGTNLTGLWNKPLNFDEFRRFLCVFVLLYHQLVGYLWLVLLPAAKIGKTWHEQTWTCYLGCVPAVVAF